jgi:hypothetical protein
MNTGYMSRVLSVLDRSKLAYIPANEQNSTTAKNLGSWGSDCLWKEATFGKNYGKSQDGFGCNRFYRSDPDHAVMRINNICSAGMGFDENAVSICFQYRSNSVGWWDEASGVWLLNIEYGTNENIKIVREDNDPGDDGKIVASWRDPEAGLLNLDGTTWDDTNWHWVCFISNGSNKYLYEDSTTPSDSGSKSGSWAGSQNNDRCSFGCLTYSSASNVARCEMAHLIIYDGIFTTAQMEQLRRCP